MLAALWLSWWIAANQIMPDGDLGKWLSVYAVFGILAVAFLGISGG
jgi:ATP-binding cassette subfamily C (CFTR/MRP) protein 1